VARKPVKRSRTKRTSKISRASATRVQNQQAKQPTAGAATPAPHQSQSAFDNLKNNLSGKRKAIFQILDDVKKVKPDDWQDPNQVERMARDFAGKLGLPVPEQRIKQFVNAYKDATKNGPNASVDEIVNKYGKNVDDKTLKEIKKFVPKTKS